jgi:zinc protease
MTTAAPRVVQTIVPGERGEYPEILTKSSGTPAPTLVTAMKAVAVPRPKDGDRRSVTVPEPTEFTLDNGIKVFYFERADAPRTKLLVRVRGGDERDPKAKLGRAGFLGYTVMRGAGQRDAEMLTRDLALNGADISVSGDEGFYRVRFNATRPNTKSALAILADVLQRPTFDPKEIDLAKREVVAGLQAAQQDPGSNADRGATAFYAENDPRSHYGTIESYGKLQADDLRAEHRVVFQPQNTEIIGSGAVPGKELVKELNAALAGWKNSGKPTAAFVEVKPPKNAVRTFLVNVPGAAQSTISFRGTGPGAADEGGVAATTAALVIGGTFNSRLNASLREDKGYTYGASGALRLGSTYGLFSAGASVETTVTGKALEELLRIVADYRTGNINTRETEVATAASYAQSVGVVSTSSALVDVFDARRTIGREWKTFAGELTKAGTLTTEEINVGAKATLDNESTLIVIAGDLEKVKPQLKGLKIGEITEMVPKF